MILVNKLFVHVIGFLHMFAKKVSRLLSADILSNCLKKVLGKCQRAVHLALHQKKAKACLGPEYRPTMHYCSFGTCAHSSG